MDQGKRRVLIIGGLMVGAILLLLWVVNKKGASGSSSGQSGYGGTIYWGGLGAPSDVNINRTTTINGATWQDKTQNWFSPVKKTTDKDHDRATGKKTTDKDHDKTKANTTFASRSAEPSLFAFELPPSSHHHGPAGGLAAQHLSTASHKGA